MRSTRIDRRILNQRRSRPPSLQRAGGDTTVQRRGCACVSSSEAKQYSGCEVAMLAHPYSPRSPPPVSPTTTTATTTAPPPPLTGAPAAAAAAAGPARERGAGGAQQGLHERRRKGQQVADVPERCEHAPAGLLALQKKKKRQQDTIGVSEPAAAAAAQSSSGTDTLLNSRSVGSMTGAGCLQPSPPPPPTHTHTLTSMRCTYSTANSTHSTRSNL